MTSSSITLRLAMVLTATLFSLVAQEPIDPSTQKVRIVVLGHQRAAEFTKTTADEIVTAPGIDGKMTKMTIPKGSPLEVRGTPFEYLPNNIFIENKSPTDEKQMIPVPWSLNDASTILELKPRAELTFLQKTTSTDEKKSETLSPYASTTLPADSRNCLIAVIANLTEAESWRNPRMQTFDTSAQAIPAGSLFFYNSTPFAIELHLARKEPMIVEPSTSTIVQPGVNSEGRTIAIVKLISRKTEVKKQFYYNTLPVPADGRCYMFAYFDPTASNASPAGIVQFNDLIK